MPTVTFEGETVACDEDDELREVLLDADLSPHNGASNVVNCGGRALCGTCAVEIDESANEDPVSEMNDAERRRLSKPPHDLDADLRLACQVEVRDDIEVRKYPGFWGQHVDREPDR